MRTSFLISPGSCGFSVTVSLAVVPSSIRIGVSVASAPQQGTTRETETIEHDVLQV